MSPAGRDGNTNEQAPAATASAPKSQNGKAMILLAIELSKTSLLVRIDHLAEKCNLIRNTLEKIRQVMFETESRL